MGKYVSLKVTQSIVTKSGGLKQLRHWPHDYCSWMIMLVFFFIDIMKNHCLVDKNTQWLRAYVGGVTN